VIKGETRVVGKVIEYHSRPRMEFIPGKMIVRVREEAVGPHLAGGPLKLSKAGASALPENIQGPVEYLKKNAGLKRITPIFSRRALQLSRAEMPLGARGLLALATSVADSTNEDLRGFAVVDVDPKKVNAATMRAIRGSKAIDIVEPMPARWIAGGGPAVADPMQNLQWGLRAIRWFTASLPEADEMRVGVMDTGVDARHPDLKGVVSKYLHAGKSKNDILGHGTHVSGIIAALTNNRVGISGIARCRISMWKIFDDRPATDGEFYVDGDAYLQALAAARAEGVRVINLSIGGTRSSQTEQILFNRLEQAGIVVVAAMGNEYQDGNPTEYPAAYDGVFAVGAVAENLTRSVFSNTGKHIALVAPGSNILSTLPTKTSPWLTQTDYASWSGTSMATPHVTAAAALLAAKFPLWGPAQIKKRLAESAARLAIMDKKWSPSYGAGLLDLEKALADEGSNLA
jgi:hypothetical protein